MYTQIIYKWIQTKVYYKSPKFPNAHVFQPSVEHFYSTSIGVPKALTLDTTDLAHLSNLPQRSQYNGVSAWRVKFQAPKTFRPSRAWPIGIPWNSHIGWWYMMTSSNILGSIVPKVIITQQGFSGHCSKVVNSAPAHHQELLMVSMCLVPLATAWCSARVRLRPDVENPWESVLNYSAIAAT